MLACWLPLAGGLLSVGSYSFLFFFALPWCVLLLFFRDSLLFIASPWFRCCIAPWHVGLCCIHFCDCPGCCETLAKCCYWVAQACRFRPRMSQANFICARIDSQFGNWRNAAAHNKHDTVIKIQLSERKVCFASIHWSLLYFVATAKKDILTFAVFMRRFCSGHPSSWPTTLARAFATSAFRKRLPPTASQLPGSDPPRANSQQPSQSRWDRAWNVGWGSSTGCLQASLAMQNHRINLNHAKLSCIPISWDQPKCVQHSFRNKDYWCGFRFTTRSFRGLVAFALASNISLTLIWRDLVFTDTRTLSIWAAHRHQGWRADRNACAWGF